MFILMFWSVIVCLYWCLAHRIYSGANRLYYYHSHHDFYLNWESWKTFNKYVNSKMVSYISFFRCKWILSACNSTLMPLRPTSLVPSSLFGIVEECKLSYVLTMSTVIWKSNCTALLPIQLLNCDTLSLVISGCLGNTSHQPINYGAVVINS